MTKGRGVSSGQHRSNKCRGGETPPRLPASFLRYVLFLVHKVPAAVLLPARLVRLGTEGLLLTVADRLDAIAADSGLYQGIFHRVGAIGAESEVVFGPAAFVAVTLARAA